MTSRATSPGIGTPRYHDLKHNPIVLCQMDGTLVNEGSALTDYDMEIPPEAAGSSAGGEVYGPGPAKDRKSFFFESDFNSFTGTILMPKTSLASGGWSGTRLSSALDLTGEMTIECLFLPLRTEKFDAQILAEYVSQNLAVGPVGSITDMYFLDLFQFNAPFSGWFDVSPGFASVGDGVTNPIGQWNHLAFIRTDIGGGDFRGDLFLNGILVGTATAKAARNPNEARLMLGTDWNGVSVANIGAFYGYMASLKIIGGKLTVGQVQEEVERTLPGRIMR